MLSRKNLSNAKTSSHNQNEYRYPVDILKVLSKICGFSRDKTIADIGCGTGILSGLFLQNGNEVVCVDPNRQMIERAKQRLSRFRNVSYLEAFAESTGIAENSVDIISVGQAFHWFNREGAGREFRRILKDDGTVVLIWNDMIKSVGTFSDEYDRICGTFCPGYHKSDSGILKDEAIIGFFNSFLGKYEFPNIHHFDLDGILKKFESTSYAITPECPNYAKMRKELENAFTRYERRGVVEMLYKTIMYVGTP